MIKLSSAYRVLTPKVYRTTINVICVLQMLFHIALVLAMTGEEFVKALSGEDVLHIINKPLVTAELIAEAVMLIVLFFMDYFVFVGISARHSGSMAAVRSSLYGTELIEKGLTGDFIANSIRCFLVGPVISVVSAIILQGKESIFTIFISFMVWGLTMIALGVGNILARRFSKTVISMLLFTYAVGAIFGVFAAAVMVGSIGVNMGILPPWFAVIGAIIAIVVACAVFICGKKDAIKGYRSGFEDMVGGK